MIFPLTTFLQSSKLIVWSICIGVNVAIIGSYIFKSYIGKFISTLVSKGATSEEGAKSLSELGYSKDKLIKRLLKKEGSLRRVVTPLDENEENKRFYIKDEHINKAKALVGGKLRWYFIPIFLVATIILSYLVLLVLPFLT